jgi:ribonuclease D
MVEEFRLIHTLSELKSLCRQLSREKILALDTEADSLYHYFPKVCLIQIATNRHAFVVDPIAIKTVEPLRPLLGDQKVKKILHGADYDLRSLFRDFGIKVTNVFDTMIASQFMGENEPALSAIVRKRFGVILDKKYQRANWSRRPLSQEMMRYAALDTAYLIRLYTELKEELRGKARLDWVQEECEVLSRDVRARDKGAARTLTGYSPLFKRFKGAGKMAPRDLAVLENILIFRENLAMQTNRPPFRLFSNRVIQDLIRVKPTRGSDLRKMRHLPADFISRYADGILEAIQKGLELPADGLPSYPKVRHQPQAPDKQARLKRLKRWRGLKAKELEIQAGLICNNVLLDALAEKNPKGVPGLKAIATMKVWQRRAFGTEIIEVLRNTS